MKKALILSLSIAVSGAYAQGMNMPMTNAKKPSASASASSMPLVDGVVQKIDTSKGLLVLKHGEIPNLAMPAMSMGFDVADRKMLKAVKPGDKVQFQAEMVGGKATVTELHKKR
jgi:Cu(I)/Ag(I) efflux system membrane protein CusA/SilA